MVRGADGQAQWFAHVNENIYVTAKVLQTGTLENEGGTFEVGDIVKVMA